MERLGNDRPEILVTDGDERAALATVRSLGRAGYAVHVCATRRHSLAGVSRFCRRQHRTSDPVRHPDEFAGEVAALVRTLGVAVLLPVTDAAFTAIMPHSDLFSEVLIPFSGFESYRALSDKGKVTEVARVVGIPVPAQLVIQNGGVGNTPMLQEFPFPAVIKPARSVVAGTDRLHRTSRSYVSTEDELYSVVRGLPEAAFPLLLQERVEGNGLGVFLLRWNGELLAVFGHRRLREKPPSGGVSVLRESVPVPDRLVRKCQDLLDAFHWEGVAMVEFKGESLEEEPVIMEVNARLWGSLQLAVDAGVDFPVLLVRAATGEPVAPVRSYQSGVTLRWFWGDVDHLLIRLRGTDRDLTSSPAAGKHGSAIGAFVRGFSPRLRGEVFRWSDPCPGILETLDWVRRR